MTSVALAGRFDSHLLVGRVVAATTVARGVVHR